MCLVQGTLNPGYSIKPIVYTHGRALNHARIAKLRRLGATKNFRGAIVTGHRTMQLTTAITDSTISKWGYTTITASEASRKNGLYPQLWHFGGTLVANEVKKNFKWICVWGARRQLGPVPLPGHVTALSCFRFEIIALTTDRQTDWQVQCNRRFVWDEALNNSRVRLYCGGMRCARQTETLRATMQSTRSHTQHSFITHTKYLLQQVPGGESLCISIVSFNDVVSFIHAASHTALGVSSCFSHSKSSDKQC